MRLISPSSGPTSPSTKANCAVLITGFGPFPGVPDNISARIARQVGAAVRHRFPSSNIVTAELPTEWDVAPEHATELICDLQPALALHFGVSNLARGFVVETIARNEAGRVDAAGILPLEAELEPFGPDHLPTQLPAGRIVSRLKRLGLPARLSRDAGTYLCNAVFYRSVLTQRELGYGGRSGFIHLPVAIGKEASSAPARRRQMPATSIDFANTVRGGIEIISATLSA
jgi:pyroglutamyl-peptidase